MNNKPTVGEQIAVPVKAFIAYAKSGCKCCGGAGLVKVTAMINKGLNDNAHAVMLPSTATKICGCALRRFGKAIKKDPTILNQFKKESENVSG